jgi:hypothetical protein
MPVPPVVQVPQVCDSNNNLNWLSCGYAKDISLLRYCPACANGILRQRYQRRSTEGEVPQ